MEFLVLFGLVILAIPFVLPIVSWVYARRTRRRLESVEQALAAQTEALARLEARVASLHGGPALDMPPAFAAGPVAAAAAAAPEEAVLVEPGTSDREFAAHATPDPRPADAPSPVAAMTPELIPTEDRQEPDISWIPGLPDNGGREAPVAAAEAVADPPSIFRPSRCRLRRHLRRRGHHSTGRTSLA